MAKTLVAYFSAGGATKEAAERVAAAAKADIFEIQPLIPYTKADLNWMDNKSRSSVEMHDKSFRPEIVKKELDTAAYDTILIGFLIWWYVAPTIINTFLESYDFSGKVIIPFATSGGSGLGRTNESLKPSCSGATLMQGKLLNGRLSETELKKWAESMA